MGFLGRLSESKSIFDDGSTGSINVFRGWRLLVDGLEAGYEQVLALARFSYNNSISNYWYISETHTIFQLEQCYNHIEHTPNIPGCIASNNTISYIAPKSTLWLP